MKDLGITNWDDQDYVDIDFRYKVVWINFGHPIDKVEDKGKNRWRVWFKKGANFLSGMMWDANLRTLQNEWIKVGKYDSIELRNSFLCIKCYKSSYMQEMTMSDDRLTGGDGRWYS